MKMTINDIKIMQCGVNMSLFFIILEDEQDIERYEDRC